jgi:hypothetical protein
VEGLFSLDEGNAIDGLFVSTQPFLHLARTKVPVEQTENE